MRIILWFMIAILTGCAPSVERGPSPVTLTPVSYDDLAGWGKDDLKDFQAAMQRSCVVLLKSQPVSTSLFTIRPDDWSGPCTRIRDVNLDIRSGIIADFQPYRIDNGGDGLFTGYYEPQLHGSLVRSGPYQTPLYARPDDLVDIDFGQFRSDWKGQHGFGKISGQNLIPYDNRATIARSGLDGRAKPLLWIDDPVAAFVLEIQGSGQIILTDGSTQRVGFVASNGRPYVAIGKFLADHEELPRPVTMQAIRQWLKDHPDRAQTVMNENPSYVFFRYTATEGAVGAQGVVLTPRRSLAVDRAFVPLGIPVWLETTDGAGQAFHRLLVAQDTGGAIKGAVRGDVFWGAGAEAEDQAGRMQSPGVMILLLPKTVTIHDGK